MNWRKDLKDGDRVTLTIEGFVKCVSDEGKSIEIMPVSEFYPYSNVFRARVLDDVTTKIEKQKRPFLAGDTVNMKLPDARGSQFGIIKHVIGLDAWVALGPAIGQDHGYQAVVPLVLLEHAE